MNKKDDMALLHFHTISPAKGFFESRSERNTYKCRKMPTQVNGTSYAPESVIR